MTNEECDTIYALKYAAEAWKKAGDSYKQIGNENMRIMCREKEAETFLNLARFRASLVPALSIDSPPSWKAKIAS